MQQHSSLSTSAHDIYSQRISTPVGHSEPDRFLTNAGVGKAILSVRPKQTIFLQGSPSTALYYILSGKVRMTVISEHGREGVVAILGPGAFFGESCLADSTSTTAAATAMVKTSVMRIERRVMLAALRDDPALASSFMTFLLSRNQQIEADLLDHLFNSSEQRLARLLLALGGNEENHKAETVIPKISQDILAARVGTTRSRINFFMNKFRKLGLIDYENGLSADKGNLKVRSSLINVVLRE